MKLNDFDGDNAVIHDSQENIPTNTSGNRPFHDVLEANLTRRKVMHGTLAVAVAGFLAPQDLLADDKFKDNCEYKPKGRKLKQGELCNFTEVTRAQYTNESLGATVPVISDD